MRCRKVKSKLNRYLDGELSTEEQGDVERHLEVCGPCRKALARLRAAAAALAQVPAPPDVPEGFAKRVVAHAARRREPRPAAVTSWRSFSPAMRLAAAAMLMVGLGLGALMGMDLARGARTRARLTSADAVYGFDYLYDAPSGSLANAYMSLAADAGGGQ